MEAERSMILRYHEEVIIDYKAPIRFRNGIERLGVVSCQYWYYITLACFNMRYLEMEIENDPFIEYPKDQNISMATKVHFNDDLYSLSCLDA